MIHHEYFNQIDNQYYVPDYRSLKWNKPLRNYHLKSLKLALYAFRKVHFSLPMLDLLDFRSLGCYSLFPPYDALKSLFLRTLSSLKPSYKC